MAFFLNSIPVPLKKNTAEKPSVKMTDVKTVMIPTLMHKGTPATPVVKMGDLVKVGTKIAQANGELSSPIYASVSGKVTKVCDYLTASGTYVPAIIITSDGEMATEEGLTAPTVNSKDELLAAIRESGVVGLGGAGFPTHVKLNVDYDKVDTLIVNGTECEPYITSDNHVMNERAGDIEYTLNAFKKYLGFKNIVIGVGDNKKTSIESMKALAEKVEGARVVALPSTYSHGSEEAIIFHTTKKVLPQGKLPADIGCVVCNVTTLAEIGKYLQTGMPFVERYVTVDGSCVKEPACVIAPIGVSLEDLFAFVGEFACEPDRVVLGGPMMGITVPSLSAPVLKTTNAVLALSEKETKFPKETACIRCGRCAEVCPNNLVPQKMLEYAERFDNEGFEKIHGMECYECGACTYVCPAKRRLTQSFKQTRRSILDSRRK